jgi:hypothetical protein
MAPLYNLEGITLERKEMLRTLAQLDLSKMPHIFIPSWNRPDFVSARLFENFSSKEREKVHIVVRHNQYKKYAKAHPNLHILPIPADYPVNGLASTRQFIFEYAVEHRYSVIIDMDDDIKHLRFMYEGVSSRGVATTKHSLKEDEEKDHQFNQKILCLAASISKDIFREHPRVMLGNLHRQKACFNVQYGKLKYVVNRETTPRQVTLLNVKALHKADINRNTKLFDTHGDDIGFTAEILKHGGWCFNIPCLGYEYLSEKCDSVMRTPENEKELHAYEYAVLQNYPIKDYLRCTFLDEDGNPMWNDVDWRKYHKVHGTQPIMKYWRDCE